MQASSSNTNSFFYCVLNNWLKMGVFANINLTSAVARGGVYQSSIH